MKSDRRLHTARDGSTNCRVTVIGWHVFHRDTKYIGGKKITDELRCACGDSPKWPDFVSDALQSASEIESQSKWTYSGDQQSMFMEEA